MKGREYPCLQLAESGLRCDTLTTSNMGSPRAADVTQMKLAGWSSRPSVCYMRLLRDAICRLLRSDGHIGPAQVLKIVVAALLVGMSTYLVVSTLL